MRDPVVTLNSNGGDRELPEPVVSEEEDTAEMVSESDNNINDCSSSGDITDDDSIISNTEQTVPMGQDLPTTVKPTESEPSNKELVIGTWNILSGRNTRLETALRALSKVGVDICFLTETKLTDGIYTRFSSGYRVLATNAVSHHQGGIALVYRESPYFQVESSQRHGPNVMSAVIVSGNSRYGVVGAYIPPADSTTTAHIASALARFPSRKVILVGDLNLNLDSLETDRDVEIADCLATSGLIDMHRHFKLEGKNRMPDTWHQEREGEPVRSRPDYFLCSD